MIRKFDVVSFNTLSLGAGCDILVLFLVRPSADLLLLFVSSGSNWLFFTPDLMRAVLVWIKEQYGNPPVYVTENGFSDNTGQLNDTGRVNYYKYYINNVLQGKNASLQLI